MTKTECPTWAIACRQLDDGPLLLVVPLFGGRARLTVGQDMVCYERAYWYESPAVARNLLDYCAKCSKDLCAVCMAKGCCGEVPAKSGNEADNSD